MYKIGTAVAAAAMAGLLASTAFAAPKGDTRDSDVGKKLFSFNVLVFPGDDFGGSDNDTVCGNNGHRIFFNEDQGKNLGVISWTFDNNANQDFRITDCDGTADDVASIVVDEGIAVWIAVRLTGPAGSSLRLVCDDILDGIGHDPVFGDTGGVDDLCIIGSETIKANKGSSFTKFTRNVVENTLEDVTWTLDQSMNAKNLQVWILEDLS